MPAAGSGASDVFRLFSPASPHLLQRHPLPRQDSETMTTSMAAGPAAIAPSSPAGANFLEQGRAAVASMSARAELAEAAAAAFKPAKAPHALRALQSPEETLTGISCVFGAGGEVLARVLLPIYACAWLQSFRHQALADPGLVAWFCDCVCGCLNTISPTQNANSTCELAGALSGPPCRESRTWRALAARDSPARTVGVGNFTSD
jgi:hypothetical protein